MTQRSPVVLITGTLVGNRTGHRQRIRGQGLRSVRHQPQPATYRADRRRGIAATRRHRPRVGRRGRGDRHPAGGTHRRAGQQRRSRRVRRRGGEFDRSGAGTLRHQLLRADPGDPRGAAASAGPGQWSDHQHRLGAGIPAGARTARCTPPPSMRSRVIRNRWITRPASSVSGCPWSSPATPTPRSTPTRPTPIRRSRAIAPLREHVKEGLSKAVRAGDDPAVVAQVVLKAATSRTPKLRYPAGPLARQLTVLKKFAPAALLDKGIRKANKLTPHRSRISCRRMSVVTER